MEPLIMFSAFDIWNISFCYLFKWMLYAHVSYSMLHWLLYIMYKSSRVAYNAIPMAVLLPFLDELTQLFTLQAR